MTANSNTKNKDSQFKEFWINIKRNIQNKDTWQKGFFILIFAVIFYCLCGLIWLLVIIQFFTKMFTGKLNSHLEVFGNKMTAYLIQIFSYVTFQSEALPFPFAPFPEGNKKRMKTRDKK